MAGKGVDPLAMAAAQAVVENPELQARVRRIVEATLKDAEYIIQFGSLAERSALTRAISPALIRGLQSADAEAKNTEARQAHERLRATFQSFVKQ